MAKAIKLPDGYYWDSSSVSHKREILNEVLNVNAVTLNYKLNPSFKFSVWEEKKINFSNSIILGNKLTADNGNVIINKANLVKVSGEITLAATTVIGRYNVYIKKNDIVISQTSGYVNVTNGDVTFSISPILIEVQPGDIIAMFLVSAQAWANNYLQSSGTYLTVEVVD